MILGVQETGGVATSAPGLPVDLDLDKEILRYDGILESVIQPRMSGVRTFAEFGVPQRIRTDNGVPFAATSALDGLSKLSVWWLRLGIQIERITPGHPEQNGRHERMHLTLKREATRPAANVLQQQDRFDTFIDRYNRERPHEALERQVPAVRYTRRRARTLACRPWSTPSTIGAPR